MISSFVKCTVFSVVIDTCMMFRLVKFTGFSFVIETCMMSSFVKVHSA
jgi:hypothetical protein